jgi:hypothetical protein
MSMHESLHAGHLPVKHLLKGNTVTVFWSSLIVAYHTAQLNRMTTCKGHPVHSQTLYWLSCLGSWLRPVPLNIQWRVHPFIRRAKRTWILQSSRHDPVLFNYGRILPGTISTVSKHNNETGASPSLSQNFQTQWEGLLFVQVSGVKGDRTVSYSAYLCKVALV